MLLMLRFRPSGNPCSSSTGQGLGEVRAQTTLRLGPSRWQRISTLVSRARRTSPAGRADRCPRLGFLRCELPPAIEPAQRGAARSAAGVAGPMGKVSSVVRHYPSPHDSQRRNGADAIHFRLGDPLDLSPRCAGVFTGYGTPSRRERRCWRLVVGRSDGPAHRYRSLVFYAAERSTVTVDRHGIRTPRFRGDRHPIGTPALRVHTGFHDFMGAEVGMLVVETIAKIRRAYFVHRASRSRRSAVT